MSIRDRYANIAPWIAVAVFCVIAATLYWSHTYSKGRQAEREYYQAELGVYDAQQQAYEECLRSNSIDRARECYEASRNPSREEQRAEQGLSAQREMADSTEGMLIVTFVVGFGTVLAASAAAWFALGTIRETRRIGEAQVRAYLTCTGGAYRIGQQLCVVHITLKNFGQSPARKATIRASLGTFDYDAADGGDFLYSPQKLVNFYEIPASAEDTGHIIFQVNFGYEICSDVVEGGRLLFVACVLDWDDVFDKNQIIEFFLVADDGDIIRPVDKPIYREGKMTAGNTRPSTDH